MRGAPARRRAARAGPAAPVALATCLAACLTLLLPGPLRAQRVPADSLESVARGIIEAARYAVLITLDDTGQPRARVMDPLPPDSAMTVWLATNPRSRKVEQIRNDDRVTLHYFDREDPGYVSLMGTARLVDDAAAKAEHWKADWDAFYPDRGPSVLLIEVRPDRLELVSVTHGLTGDTLTWTPAGMTLPDP